LKNTIRIDKLIYIDLYSLKNKFNSLKEEFIMMLCDLYKL